MSAVLNPFALFQQTGLVSSHCERTNMKEYLRKVVIGFSLVVGGMSVGTFFGEVISPKPGFLSVIPIAICMIPAFVFIKRDGSFSMKPQEWLKPLAFFFPVVVCYGIAFSLPDEFRERFKMSFDNPWFTFCLIYLSVEVGKKIDSLISRVKNQMDTSPRLPANANK